MLNATNWKDLQKQLRKMQRKAVFMLERKNSMNDGVFLRVLYQVKPDRLIFHDGKKKTYLYIMEGIDEELAYFTNGFRVGNCTYRLKNVIGG